MISLQEVSKSYSGKEHTYTAVDSVSIEIEAGEIYGIIGASGAGKSTLLRMINMLERPDQGIVQVDGQDMTRLRGNELRTAIRSIGMIFQHYHLVHNRTVGGNVAMPLELAGVPKRERAERVKELLQFVGLADKLEQYPAQLSGGQKQRVAIARALANHPKVLLCDEPTSALDPQTTKEILEVLRHANKVYGATIVLVTHDMQVMESFCHRVAEMDQGRLVRTFRVEKGNGGGMNA